MRPIYRLIALGCWLVVSACSAQAQSLAPPSGVLEYYYLVGTGDGNQAKPLARYLHITGQATTKLSYVVGQLDRNGKNLLDENYLAYGSQAQVRVGRFRSAFGHSDWSESYYMGFTHAPLLRSVSLDGTMPLNRLDTGADVQGGTGRMQYQVGLIDVGAKAMQIAAAHPDHVIARLQTYAPNLILGLNALSPVNGGGDHLTLYDLDWHWSKPHVQLSGEFLTGHAAGQHPQGVYSDVFVHPQGMLRTTFLARVETLKASGSVSEYDSGSTPDPGDPTEDPSRMIGTRDDDPSEYDTPAAEYNQLYTLGVKQVLSRQFTLDINRSWGSGDATHGLRGLTFQLITFLRF